MTQLSLQDQGFPGVLGNFEALETLFSRGARADEDLSLCFVCLRWTTGDEGCRRGYRCELQDALNQPEAEANVLAAQRH
jgi:hypothetical protein